MTEIILQPVCSKTIPDYQTSVVLNETVELLLELNQVPQIPHISKRLNKKRKKNPLSKSEGSYQKKTKLNDKEANQDDDMDMDININDRDIESLSFSTKKSKKKYCYNIWYDTLNKVKQYIDENNKRPSYADKDIKIKLLGSWLGTQNRNYKIKKNIMKDEEIYCKYTQFMNDYEKYFFNNNLKSNNKYLYNIWYNNLNKVKDYINKKKTTKSDKDKEIQKLRKWISTQTKNYKKKEKLMRNEDIYNEWTQFINEYQEYFLSNEEIWYNNLNKVKDYINKNKKRPYDSDKNKEIKQLGSWLSNQQKKYKKKKEIMKDENIYSEWTNFMNDYKKYLSSNEEIWYNNLIKVKEYIDKNKKRPSNSDKDIEIKSLSLWICNQQNKYNNKKNIMKNENIYCEWTNFMNEYLKSLKSNEEIWYDTLNKVKEYIDENSKRPSNSDKDIEIKSLSSWIDNQQNKYNNKKHIMKNEDIYSEWTNFMNEYQEYLKSYQEYLKSYQEYLLSNEEIWYNNLIKVKEYIVKNKKRPSKSDKDIEIKQLSRWINTQNKNYKTIKHTMKNEDIYCEWTNFMNDYKEYIKNYQEYLLSNEEIWYNNLIKVKEYIDNNNKKPHSTDKDIEIKQLASWIYIQQNKYNYKKHIMKNEDVYYEWTNFMNDYKEYFLSNEEIWYNNLNKVKEYIVNNNKRLSTIDKNKEIKQLASWIGTQHQNYKKKEHNMKNEEIYCEWTQFLEQYQEYFN